MGENIQISTVDGSYTAYIAHPPSGHGPGLLVLPEIYNSNEHIRGVAENFAAEGFVTLAPDVFWRIQPNCYLPYTESGQARARELNQGLDVDQLIIDLQSAVQLLRTMSTATGLIGSVGFCLGGKLSYLCATRLGVDAAVSYYGVKIENYLEEASNIVCPMVLHFAGNDPRVPLSARDKIQQKFQDRENVEIYLYPDAEHGFNRLGYSPYHEKSASVALQRTLHLFQNHLFKQ